MAKQAIITVSRKQVEADIQREADKGKNWVEAAYRVMGNAANGIKAASKTIDELIREAGGFDKLTDEQMEKYDSQCRSFIEPETQRIGHCNQHSAICPKGVAANYISPGRVAESSPSAGSGESTQGIVCTVPPGIGSVRP